MSENNNINILIDSAVLYYGIFDLKTLDNIMTQIEGKELGLSKGGLKFEAKPDIRNIEFDGSLDRNIVGMQRILKWDVSVEASILDFNTNILTASGIKKITNTSTKFDVYEPSDTLENNDYKDLLIVGKKHGSNDPIIIHIFNSTNQDGIKFETKDKDESSVDVKFIGCYKFNDSKSKPFKIYMPKVA